MTARPADPGIRPIVVLDANVLYSQVLSDYFVQAQSRRLVVLRWSSAIVDEMIRNRKKRTTERYSGSADLVHRLDAVDALRGYIERTYSKEFIEPVGQDFLPFAHLAMPDPDDRHVLATAVAAHAEYLCTCNIVDFPESIMSQLGIERATPDELLHRLLVDNPVEMVHAHQTVIDWTRGATHRTTLAALERAQSPRFKDAMEQLLASLGNLDSRDDLARAYASAIAEHNRSRAGLLPPSNSRPGPGKLAARTMTGYRDKQRFEQQRGIGAQ